MPITGINIHETKDLNIEGTIFVLKLIKNTDKFKVVSTLSELESGKVKTGDIMEFLKLGLKEIRNIVIDNESKTIKEINEETFDILPFEIVQDVLSGIAEFNFPTDTEKN